VPIGAYGLGKMRTAECRSVDLRTGKVQIKLRINVHHLPIESHVQ